MNLLDKLKEYNGNITVDQLDDELQAELIDWANNHAQESFITDDEKDQSLNELMRSTVSDIVNLLEND